MSWSSLLAKAAAKAEPNQSPRLPVDYSGVMVYMSDNNKTSALMQIVSQEFALRQAGMDRELQLTANLELGLERLDTNLQTSKLAFLQRMTEEQYRHQERLFEAEGKWQKISQGGAQSYDALPPPDDEKHGGML